MPHTDDYKLIWKEIDEKRLFKLLVDDHDFSRERIESSIKKLVKKQEQKGLDSWF